MGAIASTKSVLTTCPEETSMSVFIIAEIGINCSGSVKVAKQLIDVAIEAGCDAVKFQKRDVESVYSPEELDVPRESPFGTTNREQKMGLEFGLEEFDEINMYCKAKDISWFASAWDPKSQEFLQQYDLPYNKVASAMLTNHTMLEMIAQEGKYTYISTGMATLEEIHDAIAVFDKYGCEFELMHCVSTYPMADEDANLTAMFTLGEEFRCPVGYSGHEVGLQISLAAVAMGASSIERHITLDRAMYGSDQSASLEPEGLKHLVRDIRVVEKAMGDGKKFIGEKEGQIREKLANPYWTTK